jgi:hypothetical protein
MVAHELFHLVQFSYFAPETEPAIPEWGMGGGGKRAMETRVYPDLADIVSTLQLRDWFAAPQRPITTQPYGSQLLWRHLDLATHACFRPTSRAWRRGRSPASEPSSTRFSA